MTEAITMLYGQYANEQGIAHPFEEDMFRSPQELQAAFNEYGYEYHLTLAAHPPTGPRQPSDVPEVYVIPNPVYDADGRLAEGHIRRGDLREYPGIIDHWVENFHGELPRSDRKQPRTAFGLGLPNERLWNCQPIQQMGNRKDYMDAVLQEYGVGIPTYNAREISRFYDEQGDQKVIYKPIDGSLGAGIVIFDSLAAVRAAIRDDTVRDTGMIQPYLNFRHPIEGLVAADDEALEKLKQVNATNDRVREIRMHVIATTGNDGTLRAEAYPTLKCSQPGTDIMKVATNVALSSETTPPGSRIHDASVAMAKLVLQEASRLSGEPVYQYYGVFDWPIDSNGNAYVGDGNCRGPALPPEAREARKSFVRNVVASARRAKAVGMR